jgi:PPK2 family polyphosphate:nucleotide phosphotransferase
VGLVTKVDGTRRIPLEAVDPGDDGGLTEEEARARIDALSRELRELQELIFAAERNALLVILQGMDAAGKDVTIQHVFVLASPESVRAKHFGTMSDEEEKHHFLWRADAEVPGRGEIVIFDRSYYEQLILPLVEGEDDDPDAVARRVEDVRAFERVLAHAGTIVVKFFLHVSNERQQERLRERMENEETAYKISANDWTARERWDGYMRAYEETINATATEETPWYIVPADQEWEHDLGVAETLVERLREHRDEWLDARRERGERKRAEAEQEAP